MPGTICCVGAFTLALQKAVTHLCCLLYQQQGLLTSERLPGWLVAVLLPACPSRSMPPELLGPLQDYALACRREQGMCLSHQDPVYTTLVKAGSATCCTHAACTHAACTLQSSNLQGTSRTIFGSPHEEC